MKPKPRVRPHIRRPVFESLRYECRGLHPDFTDLFCYGYGRTIQEAYENWFNEPIPF